MPYLDLDGTAGCYAYVPYVAAFNESTLLDIRVDAAPDKWNPTGEHVLVSRVAGGVTLSAWRLSILNGGGNPFFRLLLWDSSFTQYQMQVSASAAAWTDGLRRQLRCLADTSAGQVSFYFRAPGTDLSVDTGWTQISTTQATAAANINQPTQTGIEIGADNVGANRQLAGAVYAAYVEKTGGTAVVDLDFEDTATWGGAHLSVDDDTNSREALLQGSAVLAGGPSVSVANTDVLIVTDSIGASSTAFGHDGWYGTYLPPLWSARYNSAVVYRDYDGTDYSGLNNPFTLLGGDLPKTITMWNGGVGGEHIDYFDDGGANFSNIIVNADPDVLIIGGLINSSSDPNAFQAELQTFVVHVETALPNTQIVFMSPTPRNTAEMDPYRDIYESIAGGRRAPFVDAYQAFVDYGDWETDLTTDGIHPNAAGQELMAQTLNVEYRLGGGGGNRMGGTGAIRKPPRYSS